MNNKQKIKLGISIALLLAVVLAAYMFFRGVDVAVLEPKGIIADKQRDLFLFTVLLSAVIVIPVFTLLGVFAWKYRDTNTKTKEYAPDWDGSKLFETIWWGIPCVIILILGVIAWKTSHELDPYRPIDSKVKPLEVQVVALQWKWLFIYPEQQVASVNLLEIPEKTPVNFKVTADAPMNALWIPSLGTQVYAMSGMTMKLHLMADEKGDYRGSSTNISGKDFAAMRFTARAVSSEDFNAWVEKAKLAEPMNFERYKEQLAKPGTVKTPVTYRVEDDRLYDRIVGQYMHMPHAHSTVHEATKPDQDHELQAMEAGGAR